MIAQQNTHLKNFSVSEEKQIAIRELLLATYFKDKDEKYFQSEHGKIDMDANVNTRYERSLFHIVPWVKNKKSLANKNVVEIGCGTGSSTAAFSPFVEKITAYDIDKKSLDAAEGRCNILQRNNVSFQLVDPNTLNKNIIINHPKGSVDIFLFYAVLEHMTVQERHEILTLCWDILPPDGVIVVVETPNILQYFDSHTSVLPFFHMLPSDLCARYAKKSPREGFKNDFDGDDEFAKIDLKMTRWGRGISYHDLELVFGTEYPKYIVANGYEEEILSWFSVELEEDLLRFYIEQKKYPIHPALQRSVLNFILQKKVEKITPSELPLPPPLTIESSVYKKMYQECADNLAHTQQHLQQIITSKRWKIGNMIGLPYRFIKRFLKNDQ